MWVYYLQIDIRETTQPPAVRYTYSHSPMKNQRDNFISSSFGAYYNIIVVCNLSVVIKIVRATNIYNFCKHAVRQKAKIYIILSSLA